MFNSYTRRESGAVVVIFAVTLVTLIAVLGMVIDVGNVYFVRRDLQKAADAASLAAVMELPDARDVRAEGVRYGGLNHAVGVPVQESDVEIGHWDAASRTFSPGGSPANAVRVTARRTQDHGNPVDLAFLPVLGIHTADVTAQAVAIRPAGTGTRFLIDNEMFDTDIPAVEELADQLGMTPEELLSDGDGDWWVDISEVAAGRVLELPTGQVGDAALFDIRDAFPFSLNSSPSHTDFLNFNEDGSWRQALVPKAMLDPLIGVGVIEDAAAYPGFVAPGFIHVSPLYRSDVSRLNQVNGEPAVNALGLRRGLVAFRVIGIGADPDGPSGSVLPNLIIEIVHPSAVDLDLVAPGEGDAGALLVR